MTKTRSADTPGALFVRVHKAHTLQGVSPLISNMVDTPLAVIKDTCVPSNVDGTHKLFFSFTGWGSKAVRLRLLLSCNMYWMSRRCLQAHVTAGAGLQCTHYTLNQPWIPSLSWKTSAGSCTERKEMILAPPDAADTTRMSFLICLVYERAAVSMASRSGRRRRLQRSSRKS